MKPQVGRAKVTNKYSFHWSTFLCFHMSCTANSAFFVGLGSLLPSTACFWLGKCLPVSLSGKSVPGSQISLGTSGVVEIIKTIASCKNDKYGNDFWWVKFWKILKEFSVICMISLKANFLYHLYDFLRIACNCWSTRSTPPICVWWNPISPLLVWISCCLHDHLLLESFLQGSRLTEDEQFSAGCQTYPWLHDTLKQWYGHYAKSWIMWRFPFQAERWRFPYKRTYG